MILTDKFLYIHKGKTGGDKFHQLMNINKVFTDSIRYQTYWPNELGENTDPNKHHEYWAGVRLLGSIIDSVEIIFGFRKLSSWLLSFANHHLYDRYIDDSVAIGHINAQLNKGFIPKHFMRNRITSEEEEEIEVDIYDDWTWMFADSFWGTYNQIKTKPKFIRQEYLLKDFNDKVAMPYYNIRLSEWTNNKINAFDKSDSPFKINDIETIYRNNPLWTKLEKELYDDQDS